MTDKIYDIFVSYAEADREWVEGYLLDALASATDRILTQKEFPLGSRWTDQFERAVEESNRVLLVLSSAYLADLNQQFVDRLSAFHSLKDEQTSVIVLLLEDVSLRLGLEALVKLRAFTTAERESATERICEELGIVPAAIPQITCPYPGMLPFGRTNANFFCGREKLAKELLQELRYRPCLFLIGPSGSGKTSLVSAALIPAFETEGWSVSTMQPGAMPSALLAAQTALARAPRTLLVVDQFEQVFTQADATEAIKFQEALAAWTTVPDQRLIVTMRSDFYPNLLAAPIFPLFQANHQPVLPLGVSELREAIVEPASKVNVYVERALVERLVAEAAREPGVLPHLQETMQLLWGRRRRRFLALESYMELGQDGRTGLEQAMKVVADAAIDGLRTETDRLLARRLFLRLVQFGEGRADTRRRQHLAVLKGSDPDKRLEWVRSHLEKSRLLVSDEIRMQNESIPVVDIAHEALITGWPRLQGWIKEYRNAERARRLLEEKASEWRRGGRGLLDPVELRQAERALIDSSSADLGVSSDAENFVAESSQSIEEAARAKEMEREDKVREAQRMAHLERQRANAERERARLQVSLISAAFLLVLGGGIAAWWEAAQRAAIRQGTEAALSRASRLRDESHWAEAKVLLDQVTDRKGLWVPKDLQQRIQAARDELTLLEQLEFAHLRKLTRGSGGFDHDGSAALYAIAFRNAGIAFGNEDVAVVAERINSSPIRYQLFAALHQWANVTRSNNTKQWLLAIAQTVGPVNSLANRLQDVRTQAGNEGIRALAAEFDDGKQRSEELELLYDLLPNGDEQAIEILSRAQTAMPGDFWINFNLGFALRAADRPGDALQFFQAAVAVRPELASSYIGIGLCLNDLENEENAAIAAFSRAIGLDPADPRAHNGLGNALDDQGHLSEAEAAFRRAIQLDPTFDYPHNNLGIVLKKQNRFSEAEQEFRQSITLNPQKYSTYTNLGNLLVQQGRLVAAADLYRSLTTLEPNNALGHDRLASVLRQLGTLDAAADEHRKALEIDNDNALYHYNLGTVLFDMGDIMAAEKEYRTSSTIDAEYVWSHYMLASVLARQGDLMGALMECRKAVSLDPTNPQCHSYLAKTLVKFGNFEEASKVLQISIELLPPNDSRQAAWQNLLPVYARFSGLSSRETTVGSDVSLSADEYLALALICELNRQDFAAAVAFYKLAFDSNPNWATDLVGAHRYSAACVAARAGTGIGSDASKTDSVKRREFRDRALTWLRADLDLRYIQSRNGATSERIIAREKMRHWQIDIDLLGVRDPKALILLSLEERERWETFWAEVRELEQNLLTNPTNLHETE